MSLKYTLIGSRNTPEDVIELMTKFATKGCAYDYLGKSGGADGADSCLEEGVFKFLKMNGLDKSYAGKYMEIYLPWKDFNGRKSSDAGYYTLDRMMYAPEASKIAEEIHPAWGRCKQGAQKLHTRNVFQLLGQELCTPSRFVLCYAEPKYKDGRSKHVKGGTGTCVALGIQHGVEIINLYLEEDRKRVEEWVNK